MSVLLGLCGDREGESVCLLLQTKLGVPEMLLLGGMLTLLSWDASRSVTFLRVGNADSSISIYFSCAFL